MQRSFDAVVEPVPTWARLNSSSLSSEMMPYSTIPTDFERHLWHPRRSGISQNEANDTRSDKHIFGQFHALPLERRSSVDMQMLASSSTRLSTPSATPSSDASYMPTRPDAASPADEEWSHKYPSKMNLQFIVDSEPRKKVSPSRHKRVLSVDALQNDSKGRPNAHIDICDHPRDNHYHPAPASSVIRQRQAERMKSQGSMPAFAYRWQSRGKRRNLSGGEQSSHSQPFTTEEEEQQYWSTHFEGPRVEAIQQSTLPNRNDLSFGQLVRSSTLGSVRSNFITYSCLYPNIVQKSYGNEKRFMCPPPLFKVVGTLCACRWASAQLVPDAIETPNAMMLRLAFSSSKPEENLLDARQEAQFGQLYVYCQAGARLKSVRLQINLLPAERGNDKAHNVLRQAVVKHDTGVSHLLTAFPSGAWSTFYSSPIKLISKPTRKSVVKMKSTTPTISCGTRICLYNRLNSQTARTTYLSFDKGREGGNEADVRRLISRSGRWQSFFFQLLASPITQTARRGQYSNLQENLSNEHEISYGSIVCLRDASGTIYSDPVLVCKVDHGMVDFSEFTNSGQSGTMQFRIMGEDKEVSRQILFGGRKGRNIPRTRQDGNTGAHINAESKVEFGAKENLPSDQRLNDISGVQKSSGAIGEAILPMQKLALMQMLLRRSVTSNDEVEFDFHSFRRYLCSMASGRTSGKGLSFAALARTGDYLRRRTCVVEQDASVSVDEDAEVSRQKLSSTSNAIGYALPPTSTLDSRDATKYMDKLTDSLCWTIVTICELISSQRAGKANCSSSSRESYLPHYVAQTEVSYIE